MSRLGDAWLSELWPTCKELPRHERAEKRKNDRHSQREWEEREAVNRSSTGRPPVVDEMPTGCAESGGQELSGGASECA